MANLDPYDDWKEQGRPGGSFAAWRASQGGGSSAPAPAPTPQAPAPPAAPKPDMSGFQGAGGAQRWMQASGGTMDQYNQQMGMWGGIPAPPPPMPNIPAPPSGPGGQPGRPAPAPGAAAPAGLMDFNTWMAEGNKNRGNTPAWTDDAETRGAYEAYKYGAQNPGQGGGMTEGGYSASGDPTGMRAKAKELGMSEDYDRFSNAQLASWESQKDTNCPPNKPYRSYADNTCQEKPIDSERGAQGFAAGGGGGGGGGQGFAAGGGGGTAAGGSGNKALDEMTNYWKQLTQQSGSRYTPEAIAALEADQFARARAQEKQQLAAARQDMAQRGVARSSNMNSAVRQIGVGTGQAIMQNRADIMKRKIDADFQDKQAAIQNAQNWVNSMRDYLLRGDANAIQREQIAAQMRLAQMNIDAQRQQLQQQYQNQLGLMDQSYKNNLSTGFIMGGGGF